MKEFVPDLGMYVTTKGNLLFAAVRGAVEAGLQAKLEEGVVPMDKISNPPDAVKKQFEDAKSKITKG